MNEPTSNTPENRRHYEPSDTAQQAEATEKLQDLRERAQEFAATAGVRVTEATTAVGKQAESFAGKIRDHVSGEGSLGAVATSVAENVENAGAYLQEKSLDNMVADLTSVIRRYPMQSLLIGMGVGYLLTRGADSRL